MTARWWILIAIGAVVLLGGAGAAVAEELDLMSDHTQGGAGWNPQPSPDDHYPQAVTLTSYWPFDVHSASEARMEGGTNDRKGQPLYTLEAHIADPAAAPYVSLAGDYTVYPYGTRAYVPALGVPTEEWKARAAAAGLEGDLSCYVARVVDTGGHFHGPGKVYRNPGAEPIDVCVETSRSGFGAMLSAARFDAGDRL